MVYWLARWTSISFPGSSLLLPGERKGSFLSPGSKREDPGNEVGWTSDSGGRWFEPSFCHRVVSLDTKLDFTVSLFTQMYKWVPAIIRLGVTLRQPDGPLGSYADF